MKNKLIKVLIVILFILMLSNSSTVYAEGALDDYLDNYSWDPVENPLAWKPSILISQSELLEKANVILGIINVIGVVSSVITLIIIGIKYMTGSVEQKAEYKQELVPYVIGAIFLFASTTIANVIYKLSTSMFN